MAVAIALIVVVMQTVDVYSVPSSACESGCDIKVESFKVSVKEILPGIQATVGFEVTMGKTGVANKKVDAATSPSRNFDCALEWAEGDIGSGPYTTDAFQPSLGSATFSDSIACKLDNPKDLENGLYPDQTKTFTGSCNITLVIQACEKAVFLCAHCPRPDSATYTADENSENNRKCVNVKKYIHCSEGRSCYQGEGHFELSPLRCADPNAYCMAQRREVGESLFGCTSDKSYCKGKSDDCCVCKDNNCNVNERCAGASFKVSIMVQLVTVIAAMQFF